MTKKLLMGNEAFAHAALEAGVRVVAGYPGTPSSEVIETVARLHAQGAAHDVHVEWSTNEKAALEVAAGAAYCGARTLFTCKQVGLNVASDALMSLNYVGVRGGTVLFVADDPGPISSQTEQDTRRFAAFAKVPVLDPTTPDEGFAMMKAAFDLSERYGTPVIVRPTTRICHASTFFDVADETRALPVPEGGFQKDSRWVIFPRRAYQGHGEINERLRDIERDFNEDPLFTQFNVVLEGGGCATGQPLAAVSSGNGCLADEASAGERSADASSIAGRSTFENSLDASAVSESEPHLGIVAGGVSAAYVREALSILGQRAVAAGVSLPAYRFMQVGTPYPFPAETALRFADGLDEVLVFEELDYVLEDEFLRLAGARHLPLRVRGKLTGDARDRGENTTEDILERIARFFDEAICLEHGESSVSAVGEKAAVGENCENVVAKPRIDTQREGCDEGALSPNEETPGQEHAATCIASGVSDSSLEKVSKRGFVATFDDNGAAENAGGLAQTASDQTAPAQEPDQTAPAQTAPLGGEASTSGSIAALARVTPAARYDASLPVRPPVLCAGCPHRGSFYAVKRALGKRDAVLCGDIGCYTLGNAMPLDAVDTCLCMGAGITMAQGFSVVEPNKKQVAFVGDSTFFASGLTGVVNAVYNGHDVTVAVLDNATTAMTGSQPHPGTGVTLMGPKRKPISIEGMLRAMGVECITFADPLDLAASENAAREAIDFAGPSAIIFRSPCIQLKKPESPVAVNAETCTGCKKCITEIGCPGIGFNVDAEGPRSKKRGQAFVDASLCNGCGLCVQICPFDAITLADAAASPRTPSAPLSDTLRGAKAARCQGGAISDTGETLAEEAGEAGELAVADAVSVSADAAASPRVPLETSPESSSLPEAGENVSRETLTEKSEMISAGAPSQTAQASTAEGGAR